MILSNWVANYITSESLCQRELDVITFNTLLFPAAIEPTPGRLEGATDMIVDADADVLCLQEIWNPEEIEYV